MRSLGSFLVVSTLLSAGMIRSYGADAERILLQNLVAPFIAAEGKRVQITGKFEGYNAENGALAAKPTGYYNFVSESVFGDNSWLRMECSPYAAGTPKAGEYSMREIEFVYDANKWYTLTGKIHQDGKAIEVQRCDITKGVPVWIGSDNENIGDLGALLPLFKAYGDRSIRDLIRDPKLPFQYKMETKTQGGSTVLVFSDRCSASEIYIGVQPGINVPTVEKIVLRGNLCSKTGKESTIEYVLTQADAAEIAKAGVPYFRKMERTMKVGGILQNSSTVEIQSVKLLSETGAKRDVTLAPGWIVQDQILGIGYITGNDAAHTLQSLRKLLQK